MFNSNTAVDGNGGGLAYDDNSGQLDGGTNCVQLSLYIK
jgi:hypothetical protein